MNKRLYSLKRVVQLFRDAGVHGGYRMILKREGIRPIIGRDATYYRAAEVDSFLKMVRL